MTSDSRAGGSPSGGPDPSVEHPGFILRRTVLAPRGIKQAELAARTGVPLHSVNQLLDAHRPFRTVNAQKFGNALGIDPATILKWQGAYDLAHPKPKRPPRKRRGPRRKKRPPRKRRGPRRPKRPRDGGAPPDPAAPS